MSGKEVHELMDKWAGSLGVHCDACHVADPNNIGPNGRPRMKFEDDSKKEKATARLMYTMTEGINKDYVSMIADKDGKPATPATCGTCHRGHFDPEPFVIPEEHHDGPPAAGAPAHEDH